MSCGGPFSKKREKPWVGGKVAVKPRVMRPGESITKTPGRGFRSPQRRGDKKGNRG